MTPIPIHEWLGGLTQPTEFAALVEPYDVMVTLSDHPDERWAVDPDRTKPRTVSVFADLYGVRRAMRELNVDPVTGKLLSWEWYASADGFGYAWCPLSMDPRERIAIPASGRCWWQGADGTLEAGTFEARQTLWFDTPDAPDVLQLDEYYVERYPTTGERTYHRQRSFAQDGERGWREFCWAGVPSDVVVIRRAWCPIVKGASA